MRKVADLFFLPVLAGLLLSACGNADHPSLSQQSMPAPASTPANASSAAAAVYAPASGAFAPESSALPGNGVRIVDDCNVDSVDGKPINGASLARTSTAEFAGWAADSATGTVPKRVRLVLLGLQGGGDFTMEIATGEARPDVAQAQKIPAFAASGWSVHADLSAIAPGKYDTVLLYRIHGRPVTCDPHHIVTIR